MGLVHHASYVPWLEMGRTELLREAGVSYKRLEDEGFLLVVVKLDLRFKRPALYDDVVELRTRWTGGSRVKVCHGYELRVGDRAQADVGALRSRGEDLLLTASSTLACVDRSGRPVPLPGWLMSRSESERSG